MTTTIENLHFHNVPTTSKAGNTHTIATTAASDPIPVTATAQQQDPQEGPSTKKKEASTAQQLEDLNFYLRRMNVGGNNDISQIESYGGGSDYEMFLDAVSSVGMHYGWTEQQMLRTVEMKLKDKAREYYGSLLPRERPRNMLDMKQWFRRVFGQKLSLNMGKRELEKCIRAPGESLGEYAQRLKVVANKIFPASDFLNPQKLYHRNLLLTNQFLEGLDRRLANEILRVGEYYNLDDCLGVAEECEEIVSRMIPDTRYSTIRRLEEKENAPEDTRENNNVVVERNGGNYEVNGRRGAGSMRGRFQRRNDQISGRRYERQPQEQRTSRYNETGRGDTRYRGNGYPRGNNIGHAQRFPYMENRCYTCGEEGHIARGCRKPKVFFCYHCGREGQMCSLNSRRPSNQSPR